MEVKWRNGFRGSGKVDAKDAFDECERLRLAEGDLSAQSIVDAAKAKDNALHPLFEWNNRKAAHQHRLYQARTMVRAFVVTYEHAPKSPAPAYVRVSTPTEGEKPRVVYHSLAERISTAEGRDAVLSEALAEATRWRRRYALLSELAQVFAAIDEIAA